MAPATWALRILVLKVHTPRAISAILPARFWEIVVQPFVGVVITYCADIGGTKLANCPRAPPKVPSPLTLTGIPTKCGSVLAPTVITLLAVPGDSMVADPGPELPAAIATTSPASTARLTAFTSTSSGLAPP